MSENAPASPEDIVALVNCVMTRRDCHEDEFPENLRQVEGAEAMFNMLWGIRKMIYAISRGELEHVFREKGCVPGALKAMQANLLHLTWQAQRIAAGEYHHRIDFMGDFSMAFNKMAEDLEKSFAELMDLNEKYKEQSFRDPMTGCYNRRAFESLVSFRLESMKGQELVSTVIMCDIDHFKKVNDTYGHDSGDDVLCSFTSTVASCLRSDDILCRYGGEEFVIFLPETSLRLALVVAERLRHAVESKVVNSSGKNISITSSFGVAEMELIPQDCENTIPLLEKAMSEADKCLYHAKHSGRNRVCSKAD